MVYFIDMDKKLYFTAEKHGMCGGVHAALTLLEQLVASHGQGVVVFNELVHNRAVTGDFLRRGVIFADQIDAIPENSIVVIGAHGVAPEIESSLRSRAKECFDATCPLVKKLHHIAAGLAPEESLIILGKEGHPEVRGIVGYAGDKPAYIIASAQEIESLPELKFPVFISQTTVDHGEVCIALEKLRKRYPGLRELSGVCDASQKRQEAVLKLVEHVDAVLVVGSAHSSNARRLREIAEKAGAKSFLIDCASDITPEMLKFSGIGITSGASTPEYLFSEVAEALENNGFIKGN